MLSAIYGGATQIPRGTNLMDHSREPVDIKVLFCRDTIVHEELQQHAYRLEHLGLCINRF